MGRCRVIVINDNWRLVKGSDVLYACDLKFWERYHDEIDFPGARYTQDKTAAARYGLNWVEGRINGIGLCRDPGAIHTGQNSGYQAINLAYHLGARRIALLGYDLQLTGGKTHWFGDHPRGLSNPRAVSSWVKNFTPLAEDLEAEGVEVINCTRETALDCFPRMELSKWIYGLPARRNATSM